MTPAARAAGAALARGLEAQGYRRSDGLGLQAWQAERAGRTVRINLARRSRTRYVGEIRTRELLGFVLGVECSTTVQSRLVWWVPLGLGRNVLMRWLNRRRGVQVLSFPAVLPPGRGLLACEPDWAGQVVASPAMEVVAALLEGVDGRPMRGSLVLHPGRWQSTGPVQALEAITPDSVAQHVNTVLELAQQVEALPPPRHPVTLTPMERWTAAHPVLFTLGLLGACLVALGLATLGLVAALVWMLRQVGAG